MLQIGMNERTENYALQTQYCPWENSVLEKVKMKSNLQPIDKPQKQHKKKWQYNYGIGIFEMIVVH
jgi:hypothetical protein